MDKIWIDLRDIDPKAYIDGVKKFLDFAYENKHPSASIYCPCNKCANRYYRKREVVNDHLVLDGFLKSYKTWTKHGERRGSTSGSCDSMDDSIHVEQNVAADMINMVQEGLGIPHVDENIGNEQNLHENFIGPDEHAAKILKLLKEAEEKVYPTCEKFTKLSFTVELMNIKVLNGITNKGITMILEFMKKVWPDSNIPTSYYFANKLTTDLGFTYETWDACINHCMIFRNEDATLEECSECHAPRYKEDSGVSNNITSVRTKVKKKARKKVRYFPLKPRLRRLFWSSKTAPLMRWHAEQRIDDGIMRHPADSLAWKTFDQKNPSFASDSRNIRLAIACDGINPFGNMSIAHSTWPVIVVPYNLPPWLCMKQPNLIVSMIIDGDKGPGNKIDVFLEPLIEELKELWVDGVLTYDISKNEMFKFHAGLLWTINDFPAYGDMSGWVTKGEFDCPSCNTDPLSLWLKHSGKWSYPNNRRFLKRNHRFRKDRVSFIQQKVEVKARPPLLTGEQIVQQLKDIDMETVYKKGDLSRKRKREELEKQAKTKRKHNWKKFSIFFELPYWEHNLIRHNLDVMHIEKNVCDNILFTLLDTKTKSKDHLKSRKDLRDLSIRPELHPTSRGKNMEYLPPAEFTMSKEEKDIFLKVLRDVKVPDGYSSNISRRVNLKDRAITGLKSHDSHVLMQQLLPIAIRNVLPNNVVKALIELSSCFRQLCSKVNSSADVEKLQDRIVITVCSLEKIFPPSFFDVMVHLPIHLADELLIAGAVMFRWMYPIERYLGTLKKYMGNKTYPEASIANGILLEECMAFCTKYLDDRVETKSNRPIRNDDGGNFGGCPGRKREKFRLPSTTRVQAHRYVLENSEAVQPYIQVHLEELRHKYQRDPRQVDKMHHETFHSWFKQHVQTLISSGHQVSDEIRNLYLGPKQEAVRFKVYIVNGYKFRTKEVDNRRSTQNSGVMISAKTMSYASSRDKNPREGIVTYYGQLTDIIEIRYTNTMKFVLFKCDWVNNQQGIKQDEFKFTLVNFNHLLYNNDLECDEPFILAQQAEQVWYVQDQMEPDWHVAVPMTVRDKFDMYSTQESIRPISIPQAQPFSVQELEDTPAHPRSLVRQGLEGEIVEDDIDEVQTDAMDEDNDD